jgi:hypothetical protein
MGWSYECTPSRLKDFIADRCKSEGWTHKNGTRTSWLCVTHHYSMHNPGRGTLYKVIHKTVFDAAGKQVSKERFIAVDLIRWGGGWRTKPGLGWGYKDMTEHSGPCEVDCPLVYLDPKMTDAPAICRCVVGRGGSREPGCEDCWATDWRERVRVYHAKRATGRRLVGQLRLGDRVYLKGCTVDSVVLDQIKPKLRGEGWVFKPRYIDIDRTVASITEVELERRTP